MFTSASERRLIATSSTIRGSKCKYVSYERRMRAPSGSRLTWREPTRSIRKGLADRPTSVLAQAIVTSSTVRSRRNPTQSKDTRSKTGGCNKALHSRRRLSSSRLIRSTGVDMPLDPFLTSILATFKKSHGYEDVDDPEAFERLVTFCCTSEQHPNGFDVEELCPGRGNDLGLDGVAIIASGHVITSVAQWEDLTKTLKRVDVAFVLCQAKMASHFDSAAIGTFLEGAYAFFLAKASMPENEDIADLRRIKDRIYADARVLADRPTLYLHYACAGIWKDDPHTIARVDLAKTRLEQLQLFRKVEFQPLDSERLRALFAELNQPISVTIDFPNHSTMPEISRVRQAYIGVIKCSEYLKLIQDEQNRIRRTVFSDNVRDFQGDNEVNGEIHSTLSNPGEQEWLPLLNNGATVVVRQLRQVGTKFTLEGFQVVNGCQTSYVLWSNAEVLGPNVMMPLRLIETRDVELTSKVIQATNRQTRIEIEAFESLKVFHRDLEAYYDAMVQQSPIPLRYERRSGQYDWSDTDARHVVSLANQINAYVAVFLGEPHSTHRYYGELLNVYHDRLFVVDLKDYGCYYTSELAMFRVDQVLRRESPHLRMFRSHIALLIRMSLGDVPMRTKERDRYANAFLALLGAKEAFMPHFNAAVKKIETQAQRRADTSLHELARRREFTKALISPS